MNDSNQPNSFLNKKKANVQPLTLPPPKFQAITTSSINESDINKDCSFPHEQPPYIFLNKDEEEEPDILLTAFNEKQIFIFFYKDQQIPERFQIEWNSLNVTLLHIYKFITEEELKKMKITVASVECVTKLILEDEQSNSEITNKVAVIKQESYGEVYIVFANRNQFLFAASTQNKYSFMIYRIKEENLKELILYGEIQKKEKSIKERIKEIVNPQRMQRHISFEMMNSMWKLEQLLKKEEEKTAENINKKIKEKQQAQNRTKTKEYKDELNKSLKELERIKVVSSQLDEEIQEVKNLFLKKKKKEEEEDKIQEMKNEQLVEQTKELKEFQTKVDNKIEEEKKIIEARQSCEGYLQDKTPSKKLPDFLSIGDPLPSPSKEIVNIDGVEFEVPECLSQKSIVNNDDNTREIIKLKEEYEGKKCQICMSRERNVVYDGCLQMPSCLECVKEQYRMIHDRSLTMKNGAKSLKGKFVCPSCNIESAHIKIIEII